MKQWIRMNGWMEYILVFSSELEIQHKHLRHLIASDGVGKRVGILGFINFLFFSILLLYCGIYGMDEF